MWHVVLNEEMLPDPHGTPEEAAAAGEQLAAAFEAVHGRPACWFVARIPATH